MAPLQDALMGLYHAPRHRTSSFPTNKFMTTVLDFLLSYAFCALTVRDTLAMIGRTLIPGNTAVDAGHHGAIGDERRCGQGDGRAGRPPDDA